MHNILEYGPLVRFDPVDFFLVDLHHFSYAFAKREFLSRGRCWLRLQEIR